MRFISFLMTLVLAWPALAQQKSVAAQPTVRFAQIVECVAASNCRNMTSARLSLWADFGPPMGMVFVEAGWKYELALSGARDKPRHLSIMMTVPGETRPSQLLRLDDVGLLVAGELARPAGEPAAFRGTREQLEASWKKRKAYHAGSDKPDDATRGAEFRPFWQEQADRALAAIRRQLTRPDSWTVIDYMGPPKTFRETLGLTSVVVVGQVADVGEPRVAPGEQSVHRQVQLRIHEVLRDSERALGDRTTLALAVYGGRAEADGKLRGTADVLQRPLDKSEWVLLLLAPRKDGLFTLLFGSDSVIRLGDPEREWTVTLPWSFSQMDEFRRSEIRQDEFLTLLGETAGSFAKTEVQIAAIIECVQALNCRNMTSGRLSAWSDAFGIVGMIFSDAGWKYELSLSGPAGRPRDLAIMMTAPGDTRPSQLLTLDNTGKPVSAELARPAGEPAVSTRVRTRAELEASWKLRKSFVVEPRWPGGGTLGAEFRPFWQEQADRALAAIRRQLASTAAQEKQTAPVSDLIGCVKAASCRNAVPATMSWADMGGISVATFTEGKTTYALALSRDESLNIWVTLEGERRAGRLMTLGPHGRVLGAQLGPQPGETFPPASNGEVTLAPQEKVRGSFNANEQLSEASCGRARADGAGVRPAEAGAFDSRHSGLRREVRLRKHAAVVRELVRPGGYPGRGVHGRGLPLLVEKQSPRQRPVDLDRDEE